MPRPLASLALVLALTTALPCRASDPPEQSQVLTAALSLMNLPKAHPLVVISEKTLNRNCGDDSGNVVRLNGCGIFQQDQPLDLIAKTLTAGAPTFSPETWTDFLDVTRTSKKLHDDLTAPWPHPVLDLEHPPAKMPDADAVILFSRIGFNHAHTQALVYMLFVSYVRGTPTTGNLLLFDRTAKGEWKTTGRLQILSADN